MSLSAVFTKVKSKQIAGEQVGCLAIKCSNQGWTDPIYDHAPTEHLTPDEVQEFSRLAYDFVKTFGSPRELNSYFRKHGERVRSDGFDETFAIGYSGQTLNYVANNTGNLLSIFPYRK